MNVTYFVYYYSGNGKAAKTIIIIISFCSPILFIDSAIALPK